MKRITRKIGLWVLSVVAVTLTLLSLFIIAIPQGRTGFNTALFVLQVLDLPIKPQTLFTTEPVRHQIQFGSEDVADVYRLPDSRPRAAVLLSLGATPHGLDDPAAVMLSDALARAGYVTMVHWSPQMGLELNLDPSDTDKLVQAFKHMEHLEYVDPDRVGIGGFCAGASLALVAAADPTIRDRVDFVNAFGPFYDIEELLIQAVSKTVMYDGEGTPWEPEPLTIKVLATELIERLDSPSDVRTLTRHYLEQQPPTPAPLDSLSPVGRTAARLLNGVPPDEVEALYAMLPLAFREELILISPSTYVDDLRARLLIMHDRHDRYVPAAESRRLLETTQDRINVRYTEFIGFDHLLPDEDGVLTRLEQALNMYRHMYSILRIAS
ncbi:MAG: dienelactone hydrolase family protein [Dehalococcoidia bacterium]|nr:dienelactone hydrolase family protein [Dehalococcoidia bacterium]